MIEENGEKKLNGEVEQVPYEPNEKQRAVVSRVLRRFDDMRSERDKSRREFDGRTLTQYVNDNVDAWNGIVPDEIKASKENWQSLIFDNKTRGKVKAVVSMIVASRPYLNIVGTSQYDDMFADDMKRVYDDAYNRENGSFKAFRHALSATIKGTAIIEEGYYEHKKKIKEISSIDHQTGQVSFTEKEVIENGRGEVFAELVPLLNFYPNENSPEIEHDCIVMSYPSLDAFQKKYSGYEATKYVVAGQQNSDLGNQEYTRVKQDRNDIVEVMKYYNEDDDEFIILANGVWMNPQKNDETSPLPFDHKKLPFTKLIHEYADEECFYGKAFPDLVAGEQDTSNAILRMVVDQEILAIHKPILMGAGIELDSASLFPGKQFRATGDVAQIRELQMSGASQSSMLLLDYLDRRASVNTAVDPNAQGVHLGRKTAKEAVILDENSKRVAGIFQIFVFKNILDRARLRISNIKQFYREPIQYRPILDASTGKAIMDNKGQEIQAPVYREIPINDSGKKPYWLSISPELCGANFEVRLEEDYEVTDTRSQRIEIARVLLDEAKANPLIDADEATIEWLKALGKNPTQFYIRPDQEAPAENTGEGAMAGGEQPNPKDIASMMMMNNAGGGQQSVFNQG